MALTDHYSPRIAEITLNWLATVDVDAIVRTYGALVAKDTNPLAGRIRAGLGLTDADLAPMTDALTDLSSEAYLTGTHAATTTLGAHAVTQTGPISDAVISVDWSAWKPGDTLAAASDAGGALRERLGDLGITVKGISDTVLDQIGDMIADGLTRGDGADAISRDLRDALGDPTRADRIAHTEVARAQTDASMTVYRVSGVTEYDVLTADDADAECVDIAANGPYALTDDTGQVPIHPFCRCADVPVIGSIDSDLIESLPEDDSEE